jgi:CheY-like chemotaxis protein
MIKILLVDDNKDILGSIKRTLPRYDVDDVQSYEEALGRLQASVPYDVAIVDLNLTEEGTDKLGEDLLDILQKEYSLILRIALTGETPSAVQEFLERFKLADLLLKQNLDLGKVREVVRRVVTRAGQDMPVQLRSDRGERWGQFSKWRDERTRGLKGRAQALDKDLQDFGLASARGRQAANELARVRAQQAALEQDCSAMAVKLANVRNEADLATATADLAELQAKYRNALRRSSSS